MRAILFKRFGYPILIVALADLMLFSTGLVPLIETSDVAFADSDPVIAAAGDIACDPDNSHFNDDEDSEYCQQKYTSDLLVDAGLAAVLPLGDVQYYCAGYQAFLRSYGPSWGRVKSISHPVVGNHEYLTSGGTDCTQANAGAAGYFKYFGSAAGNPSQGYYSYDIGAWHLIALNSNCGDAGGCGIGSPQAAWLRADLALHPALCTLAYWHIPLFSSGGRTSSNTQVIWQILYNKDVDVILNGHDHIYERFAPQSPDGLLDPERGIREFVVGTGGANLTDIESIASNSEIRNNDTYGVLKLTLHPTGYDWQFVPEEGKTFMDSGTGICHGDVPTSGLQPTMTPAPTQTAVPTRATMPFTFNPVADAYISKTLPGLNYGTSNMLRVYGGPLGAGYLRFEVHGLPGTVARATLRLYAHSESNSGYQVRALTDTAWDESTITYSNAPPIGDVITISEPFRAREWTSADLTSLVRGDGTFSIVLITFNAAPLSFASRDAIAPFRPQLVVDVLASSTSAPAPTQTFIASDSAE